MAKLQLNFAHICEKAFLSIDGKINIIGDFDRIKILPMPDQNKPLVNFNIVTNFSGPAGEYKQSIEFRQVANDLLISKIESSLVIREKKAGFIAGLGIVLPGYGEFVVKIFIDGEKYIELPLMVEKLGV